MSEVAVLSYTPVSRLLSEPNKRVKRARHPSAPASKYHIPSGPWKLATKRLQAGVGGATVARFLRAGRTGVHLEAVPCNPCYGRGAGGRRGGGGGGGGGAAGAAGGATKVVAGGEGAAGGAV